VQVTNSVPLNDEQIPAADWLVFWSLPNTVT